VNLAELSSPWRSWTVVCLDVFLAYTREWPRVDDTGTHYLFELGVGSIPHKLQNESFTGGEENTTLSQAGQCH
jgi:hypothetical protein